MSILLFITLTLILMSLSGYLLFPKLDLPAWKGAVPVLRWMEISEKVGRSRWFGIMSAIPILNIFIITGLSAALVRSFGKLSLADTTVAVLYNPIAFYLLSKDASASFKEPVITKEREYLDQLKAAKEESNEKRFDRLIKANPYKKGILREWFESIVFAVFAAAFIRMFFIEAYVIPTPSMEGTLLVGDFLFVSKMSYGIRTPQTIAMIPLLHNRIPFLHKESYLSKPSLPYYRLPPRSLPQRNDPFVFNWPVGDSVYITGTRSYTLSQVERAKESYLQHDPELNDLVNNQKYVVRPLDKKDHYIKRCVGIAGDSLQVIEGKLYINGQLGEQPPHVQLRYRVSGDVSSINPKRWEEWGIEKEDIWQSEMGSGFVLDETQVAHLKGAAPNIQVTQVIFGSDPVNLFPHDPVHFPNWSVDNYGPIWIPKAGSTIQLSKENIALYQRIIAVYEGNTIETTGETFKINGEDTRSYTFKQNYYWAMGDNRHNSEDSRSWGFVPFDHVMGKPALIWLSTKNASIRNGIRWNRLFTPAGNL